MTAPGANDKDKSKPEDPSGGTPPADKGPDVPDWVKDPVKAYAEIKNLRDEAAGKRREIKDIQDKLAVAEQEDAKKRGDYQKLSEQLQKQLSDLQSQLKTEQLNSLRLKVAQEFGIPQMLALRLQGDDEEALRKDAEALAATLPKPQVAPGSATSEAATGARAGQRAPGVTGVPGGIPAQLSREQKLQKYLYGSDKSIFSEGGGYVAAPGKTGGKDKTP